MIRWFAAATALVMALTCPVAPAGATQSGHVEGDERLVPAERPSTTRGYWLFSWDGGVFSFGDAPFHGSGTGRCHWEEPLGWCLAAARHPSGNGYWLMNGAVCRVLAFGAARHFGDRWASGNPPRDDFASCGAFAATPSGNGYWTVTQLGTVLPWGDARWHGDVAGGRTKLIVGIVPTPSGNGYWLLGEDGGVFSFGDAGFHGSAAAMRLNQPIVGMARTPTGGGYWLVGRDGGVFTFGDARFFGSTGGVRLNRPVNSITASPEGDGYYLVADDGGVFTFGNVPFLGSTGGQRLAEPVAGLLLR